MMTDKEISKNRQELKDRMEKLKDLPPPTLEEARQQFAASAEFAKTHDFDCVQKIKQADHIR